MNVRQLFIPLVGAALLLAVEPNPALAQQGSRYTLTVRVTDQENHPLSGILVGARGIIVSGGTEVLPTIAVTPTPTNAQGEAKFPVAPGPYQVTVYRTPQYGGNILRVEVRNQDLTLPIQLARLGGIDPPKAPNPPEQPGNTAKLTVRAVNPQLQAATYPSRPLGVPGVTVSLQGLDNKAGPQTRVTDATGNADFAARPGRYRVTISRAGRFSVTTQVVLQAGQPQSLRVDGLTGKLLNSQSPVWEGRREVAPKRQGGRNPTRFPDSPGKTRLNQK
jgi:hypothetical protein